MGRFKHHADNETRQAEEGQPPEPAEGAAPPAALGDVEDAVAEEVEGALTRWSPYEPEQGDESEERAADDREPGGAA